MVVVLLQDPHSKKEPGLLQDDVAQLTPFLDEDIETLSS